MVNIISTLKKMANKLISLNNTKLDIAKMQALYGTRTTLQTSWSKATNWSTAPSSFTAQLMGDKILVYINITRDSSYTAGNMTNENIGTFNIKTLGAVTNVYTVPVTNEVYGQTVTGYTSNLSFNGTSGADQTITFNITLTASHAAGSQLSFRFFMPARPNLSYYGLS